jgi:hypothetical protein
MGFLLPDARHFRSACPPSWFACDEDIACRNAFAGKRAPTIWID